MNIAGTTNLNAGSNNIILDNFNQLASVQLSANNVAINSNDAIDLGQTNLTGNLDLTANGDITNSATVAIAGNSSFTTTQIDADILLDNLDTDGTINLNSSGNATVSAPEINLGVANTNGSLTATATGNLSASGVINAGDDVTFTGETITLENAVTSAGEVDFETTGNINTANITASEIEITSEDGVVTTGNLDTSGISGGEITIEAEIAITTNTINTSGNSGDAGDVFLDPELDIEVSSINAQGGDNGSGGDVTIITERFFRATDTFSDRNGENVSISAAGGQGSGNIAINHGGDGEIPFIVGESSENGTVGVISSGETSIIPGSYPFPLSQGNIELITEGSPPVSEPDTDTVDNTPQQPQEIAEVVTTEVSLSNDLEETLLSTEETEVSLSNDLEETLLSPEETEVSLSNDLEETILSTEETEVSLSNNLEETILSTEETEVSLSNNLEETILSTEETEVSFSNNLEETILSPEEAENTPLSPPITIDETQQSTLTTVEVATIEASFTEDFEAYVAQGGEFSETGETGDTSNNFVFNFTDPKATLKRIQAATDTKPAIIYASFSTTEMLPGESQPLLPSDQLDLVIVTPNGTPVRVAVPDATREKVTLVAKRLYNQVSNRGRRYLKPAQQMYQWLIAPLESELERQGIDNLLFIMDEGLRLIPVAALHDGEKFLAQKYSSGLAPSLSLTDTNYRDIKEEKVLVMGASEFPEEFKQTPLPAVKIEVPTIAHELWFGSSFLNEEFTFNNLQTSRDKSGYGIVHLATHADFKQGDFSERYIQLFDRKLQFQELRQLGWGDPPVELLILSACRSAYGGKEAELGFAGLAVQSGVKSALASLWYVGDTGTLGLMTEFYRQLRQVTTKSNALQETQMAMIEGRLRKVGGELVSTRGNIQLPEDATTIAEDLSHPYYWAAFTLIGNPW